MNEKELLQELVQSVKNVQAEMQNMQANMQAEMQNMRADISEIKDRTLKIEITLENETNKNIQLLMEAQSLNAEKMKDINFALDDIESSVVATEAIVRQNIRDINVLKEKAQ